MEPVRLWRSYYSNVARGKRKKTGADDKIPCILEPELADKAFRRNWARLIQKIYEVDPLVCPKSQHFSRFGEKYLLDNTTGILSGILYSLAL
ncbi:hypothetical protein ACFL0M_03800 [Thermodesulfobacteriota bacterium]